MLIFDLEPRAALHVGEFAGIEREAVQSYIPSDTLFAALVVAWRSVRPAGEVEARLQACQVDPPALWLSSAFPRAGSGDEAVRLYPMPLGLRLNAREGLLDGKQRKRIKWVSQGIFDHLLAFGKLDGECDPQHNFAQGGSAWLTRAELAHLRTALGQPQGELVLWRTDVVPRVTVDRQSSASNLFHAGRLVFAPGCGLWCAAQGAGATWVREGLEVLKDSGIGGLRSIGHGAFDVTALAPGDVARPAQGYGVCLSRYAPRSADEVALALQAPHSAYGLVAVGGWCQDDAGKAWRRKGVRLIAEGACLGAAARGHLVDVRPEGVMSRPVYRYGLAFTLPVSAAALMD